MTRLSSPSISVISPEALCAHVSPSPTQEVWQDVSPHGLTIRKTGSILLNFKLHSGGASLCPSLHDSSAEENIHGFC